MSSTCVEIFFTNVWSTHIKASYKSDHLSQVFNESLNAFISILKYYIDLCFPHKKLLINKCIHLDRLFPDFTEVKERLSILGMMFPKYSEFKKKNTKYYKTQLLYTKLSYNRQYAYQAGKSLYSYRENRKGTK